MKKNNLTNPILLIATFLLAYYGKRAVANYFYFSPDDAVLKIIVFYLWWIIPTFSLVIFLFGFKHSLSVLGLQKGLFKGIAFSFVAVMPMLLSSAILGKIDPELNLISLIQKTVLAGFMEEYLFRGFLFGLLFLKLGWGFIPSALLGALIFGMGHVYQGHTFSQSVGVFLLTSIGAVWFAWLYIEWNNNLWVPIFLHMLMNLSWALFDISANALGEPLANFFRIITIAITVVITIRNSKQNGFKVNRHNLLSRFNATPCVTL